MNNSGWETVVGLEIHVQLDTNSKIFSSAPVAFGDRPNQNANLVDVAMPGTLPVLNDAVVDMAVKFGLAVNANIADVCRFDRKNYFYPDLPKGYQISQLDEPIVGKGALEVVLDDGTVRTIGITRAHLEEDAGKSLHDRFVSNTGIDLNRAGTPLLEIVTEPDLRSPAEAAACFRQLHTLVTWLDICDGNLNEGSMRCDANVSVRREGDDELGERTEIKNINSFRFVEKALEYEALRQIDLLTSGEQIERETRLYDASADETRSMRGKELSDDYRYFPDPDLLPVRITKKRIQAVRATLPELPHERLARYKAEHGIASADAARLLLSRSDSDYFDEVCALGADAQQAANWLLGEVTAIRNRDGAEEAQIPLSPIDLVELITRVGDGTISNTGAKRVLEGLWQQEGSVDSLIEKFDLRQLSDASAIESIVEKVVADHPQQVSQIKAGRTKVRGFLIGQVMKETRGKANPKQVNEVLDRLLRI